MRQNAAKRPENTDNFWRSLPTGIVCLCVIFAFAPIGSAPSKLNGSWCEPVLSSVAIAKEKQSHPLIAHPQLSALILWERFLAKTN